jgi:AcrR family transcriptional regulator
MTALRRDAARNRELILDAARELDREGQPLQLNAVARLAGVGVGTVYRHFPSSPSLTEGLVEHRFVERIGAARAAAEDPDALRALRQFLAASLTIYVDDAAFAEAVIARAPARDETRALRAELIEAFGTLVARAADFLRPGLDPVDLMVLLCGLGYSARLRPERAGAYLDALMDGVLAR